MGGVFYGFALLSAFPPSMPPVSFQTNNPIPLFNSTALFHLGPRVFEGDGAVEDGFAVGGIEVGAEVADAFELDAGPSFDVGHGGLEHGGDDAE